MTFSDYDLALLIYMQRKPTLRHTAGRFSRALSINRNTVYVTLERLERRQLIDSLSSVGDEDGAGGAPRRSYQITRVGEEVARWLQQSPASWPLFEKQRVGLLLAAACNGPRELTEV